MAAAIERALKEMAASDHFAVEVQNLAQDALELAKQTFKRGSKDLKDARAAAKELSQTRPTVERNGINFEIKAGEHLVRSVPVPYKVVAENGAAPWAPLVKWDLPKLHDGKVIPGGWKEVEFKVPLSDPGNTPDRPGIYLTDNPYWWKSEGDYIKHPELTNPLNGKPYPLKVFEADVSDHAAPIWIYGGGKSQRDFRTNIGRLTREATEDERRELYSRYLSTDLNKDRFSF